MLKREKSNINEAANSRQRHHQYNSHRFTASPQQPRPVGNGNIIISSFAVIRNQLLLLSRGIHIPSSQKSTARRVLPLPSSFAPTSSSKITSRSKSYTVHQHQPEQQRAFFSTMDLSTPAEATPPPNNHNNNNNNKFTSITEGSITMKYPADEETAVFYNPVQVQNRDLSILMLVLFAERRAVQRAVRHKKRELRSSNKGKAANAPDRLSGEQIKTVLKDYEASLDPSQCVVMMEQQQQQQQDGGLSILDALAASGLRSMRYWKEIPGVQHVTINDLDPAAVERAEHNIEENGLTDVLLKESLDHSPPTPQPASTVVDQEDTATSNKPWQRPYGIQVQNGDAKMEMYLSQRPQAQYNQPTTVHGKLLKPQWDVIDLDPYGSAAPFLDAAVQAIESGGMLNVTCTDMAALGGSHPETCYGRYASMPIPSARYLQEAALRILLGMLATTAAKYGRTIKPILSVGMNFYIRVFVEVYDDKAGVLDLSLQMGSVFQSTQCASFHLARHGRLGGRKGNVYQPERAPPVPQCEETGADFKVGGPMWLGPLHSVDVVQTALARLRGNNNNNNNNNNGSKIYPDMKWIATQKRLEGLLMSVRDELVDAPLYYGLPEFCRTLKCSSPPIHMVHAALLNSGYKVSGYHKDPQAIKTDAPSRFMWDILRTWIKQNPLKKEPEKDSPAAKILAVEPTSEIDFTVPADLKEKIAANNKKGKVSRFPMNPEKNWGPKKAASGHKRKAETDDDNTEENKKR